MIMQKPLIVALTALSIALFLISPSSAQDTLLISYQGHLTDDGGNPITGSPSITFSIYDGAGVSKWTESHASVQVDDGLFSVMLGSQTALPYSIFTGEDLYLGISIGEDAEILPRTLLASTPGAVVSKRVIGDITTAPGIVQIHPPDPCVPPDQCNPAVEIAATMEHRGITINLPLPDDSRPAIELSANNESKIDLYYPDAESDEGIVQIGANAAEGAFIELHAADSLTATRIMMGGSTADTGFVRLFGGTKGLEYKMLELNSHSSTGGNVAIFDPENIDGRELLRIGRIPDASEGVGAEMPMSRSRLAEGIGIYGFNPQPEPPGHIAFELTSEISQGGRLAVYDTDDAGAVMTGGLVQLGHADIVDYPTGTFSVTSLTSQLTLLGAGAAGDAPVITMVAGADGAKVGIGIDAPGDELYVVGDITATGAITELSSRKYKTNINQMSDALEKVRDLRGVNFEWRAEDYPEMNFPESKQVGLIAEEVERVVPQLVHSDNTGELSVDYSKLTAVLVEAIKEQQRQIEVLSERVKQLEKVGASR